MTARTALLAAFCLAASACSGPPDAPSKEPAVDRIVVHYGPSVGFGVGFDGGGELVDGEQRVEIDAPETVASWLLALDRIPEQPVRGVRLISFAGDPPEHRIEFYAGDELLRIRRMKAGLLDVAAHDGWAFYSGEDEAFTSLVTAVVPGG